jgi:hypothetical protein
VLLTSRSKTAKRNENLFLMQPQLLGVVDIVEAEFGNELPNTPGRNAETLLQLSYDRVFGAAAYSLL